MSRPINVACLQMNSGPDVASNLEFIKHSLIEANDIDLLVLPENFAQIPANRSELVTETDSREISEEPTPIQNFLKDLAAENHMVIIAGSLPITVKDVNKPYSRCLIVTPTGIIDSYDKIHLFDVEVTREDGRQRYHESDTYQKGTISLSNRAVKELNIGGNDIRLGTSICYDLRFPELYRGFAQQDANLVTVPSAFTYETGLVHWELMLRARAIENQNFVLAAAQVGVHANHRRTWGQSMIVDPWGKVIAQMEPLADK
ncbi:MAG: carbon-nitrogen hydrolase family protein, partial [Gammaproteobacteria bacterium]|nr:carbon-nitrogen hydrolase family protein [Gammaproteobacteria bacterium]